MVVHFAAGSFKATLAVSNLWFGLPDDGGGGGVERGALPPWAYFVLSFEIMYYYSVVICVLILELFFFGQSDF